MCAAGSLFTRRGHTKHEKRTFDNGGCRSYYCKIIMISNTITNRTKAAIIIAALALAAVLSLTKEFHVIVVMTTTTSYSEKANHNISKTKNNNSSADSNNNNRTATVYLQTNSSDENGPGSQNVTSTMTMVLLQPPTTTSVVAAQSNTSSRSSNSSSNNITTSNLLMMRTTAATNNNASANNTTSDEMVTLMANTALMNVMSKKAQIIIIIQLSGGMGNNLSKLAHGLALQHWIIQKLQQQQQQQNDTKTTRENNNNHNITLVLRHQDNRKWVAAQQRLHACFPWTRQYNFQAGHDSLINNVIWSNHENNLIVYGRPDGYKNEKDNDNKANYINSSNQTLIELAIDNFLLDHQQQQQYNHSTTTTTSNTTRTISSSSYIYSNHFLLCDFMMNRYYDDFKRVFHYEYNNTACCNPEHHPESDETVFHFRNYKAELPKVGKKLGFEDLSPTVVANELFGHLPPGSKIAIVTLSFEKQLNETHVYPYIQALQERGLMVRVVTPQTRRGHVQTDMHDFCFLLHTQKELVGMAKSTYLLWAAILGNAEKVRLYSIDSKETRQNLGNDAFFYHYNWTHNDLKQRIHFELYHL